MFLPFQRIPSRSVIITCQIQHIQSRRYSLVSSFGIGGSVHTSPHHGRHHVEHGAVHAAHLFIIFLIAASLFLIDPLSLGCGINNHEIESGGNRPAGIQLMHQIHHFLFHRKPLFLGRLRNFISNRIQNYRRMIVISGYHGF